MKTTWYKFLVFFFYTIGDIACRFNFDFTFYLYQKCMNLSIVYDEKINFWWWKEPTLDEQNEL